MSAGVGMGAMSLMWCDEVFSPDQRVPKYDEVTRQHPIAIPKKSTTSVLQIQHKTFVEHFVEINYCKLEENDCYLWNRASIFQIKLKIWVYKMFN